MGRPEKVTLFRDRHDRGASTFALRKSEKKSARLTDTAANNLLIEEALTTTMEERRTVCAHYHVTLRAFDKVRQRWAERGTAAGSVSPGRPSIVSPTKKQQLREANSNNRRLSAEMLALHVRGTTGGGRYRGNKKAHVGEGTVLKMKREEQYVAQCQGAAVYLCCM